MSTYFFFFFLIFTKCSFFCFFVHLSSLCCSSGSYSYVKVILIHVVSPFSLRSNSATQHEVKHKAQHEILPSSCVSLNQTQDSYKQDRHTENRLRRKLETGNIKEFERKKLVIVVGDFAVCWTTLLGTRPLQMRRRSSVLFRTATTGVSPLCPTVYALRGTECNGCV
jgi:hypothetical protein